MNLYGYEFERESDLMHYGVIGMRWGVRRYQDKNGRLTTEGRRHLLKEVKTDNKEAYELGKAATLSGKALEKEYKKLQNTKIKNLDKEQATYNALKLREKKDRKAAEEHYRKLVDKYGKDFVSNIKKTKFGTISEKTTNYKDFLKAVAMTGLLTVPLSAVIGGLSMISIGALSPSIVSLFGGTEKALATVGATIASSANVPMALSYKQRKDRKAVKSIRKQPRNFYI